MDRDAIIDSLVERLADNNGGDVVGAFARAYLRRIPPDYLLDQRLVIRDTERVVRDVDRRMFAMQAELHNATPPSRRP